MLQSCEREAGIPAKSYPVNQRIRATNVRVIDENGEQLGVLALRDALNLARERGLDLVEVAASSDPPVCRILDYGKFRYLQAKKEREGRKGQKSTALREVRVRPAIGQHDLDAKCRTAQKLLAEGSRVKVSVQFRGRAITHPELGVALLRKIAEGLQTQAKLDQMPAMEGRILSIILSPSGKGGPISPTQDKERGDREGAEGAQVLATQEAGNAKAQNA